MIGKVLRGSRVGGLLRYLFGPGRSNEHQAPHLVASWDDAPTELEPPPGTASRPDVRHLTGLLEQPLALTARPAAKPVWHCALRAAPGDRILSDTEWAEVAKQVVTRTGFAAPDDDGGCRWVAVRHAPDHIHLVVMLARQDGGRVSTSNDFYKLGEACRWAERTYGLTGTAPRDRTAAKRPTRGEAEKATRRAQPAPSRVQLRRTVATAAAGARSSDDFLRRLSGAGVLVRERHHPADPDRVTGYAVALPGDRNAGGQPVWYGGGKLASDLTWPKLQHRWGGESGAPVRLIGPARAAAWRDATQAATDGAATIRRLAAVDPAAASDTAHATADTLRVTASIVEGRRGGPLTDAAEAYDRASRELHGRTPRATPLGNGLRSTARLLALTGRATRDETAQMLALITALTALSEAVAVLREAQGRHAQASAAHSAAQRLRLVAPTTPADVVPRRPATVPVPLLARGAR